MNGREKASIAVCIPVFNGEKYLAACLDSILAQTVKPDEIIVVDDGSRDRSRQIVANYQKLEPRIRYFQNATNLGLVGNWNHCVTLATSDWIKFVFQDDLLLPACLERMIACSDGPEDLIACRRDIIFETPPSESQRTFYAASQTFIDRIYAGKQRLSASECRAIALDEFGHNVAGEPSSVLIRRCCFDRYGNFRDGLVMSCDLEYWIRVGIHSGIRFVPETLSTFRVHAGATSAENFERRSFRMHSIDNLLLLRDFSREPVYEPLRTYAETRKLAVGLDAMVRQRRNEAFATARWAARRLKQRDLTLRRELEMVYEIAPDLRVGPLENLIWRIRKRFFE